jgi:isopentenyl-diphosphate delta-isomerase type 1
MRAALHRCARSASSSSSSSFALYINHSRRARHHLPPPPHAPSSLQTAATMATATTTTWTPQGATQDEFMLRDQCIVVDEHDNVAGAASKLDCHRFGGKAAAFGNGSPTGRLHRAFSVFLFDRSGRLLLQQRAASKITFPEVWTNTCCSHQLHGQPSPGEVDDREIVEREGRAPGAVAAARRKLAHELGIDPAALPASCFTFVTRLHYCAPDSETHGPDPEWGEHEVDYILLARMKGEEERAAGEGAVADGGGGGGAASGAAGEETGAGSAKEGGPKQEEGDSNKQQHAWEVPPRDNSSSSSSPAANAAVVAPADPALGRPELKPDPDEVMAVRWVTAEELEQMMLPESGLRWSPWFRIIARQWLLPSAENGGGGWWRDLDAALRRERHGDYDKVHRIDC